MNTTALYSNQNQVVNIIIIAKDFASETLESLLNFLGV